MELVSLLSITSSSLLLLAFWVYNRQIFTGKSTPNTATWLIWSFITVMNSTSYFKASADLTKSILPIVSSIACLLTVGLLLIRGKIRMIEPWEAIILVIGILSAVVWWVYQSAIYANLVLQFGVFLSFIPTIIGVLRNKDSERSLPWFLWSASYVLMTIVLFLHWTGDWLITIAPAIGIVMHGIVGCLARK